MLGLGNRIGLPIRDRNQTELGLPKRAPHPPPDTFRRGVDHLDLTGDGTAHADPSLHVLWLDPPP